MQRVLKTLGQKQDAYLLLSCLALAVCSAAFVWASDSLPAPSFIHTVCSLACILGGVAALCFGLACLSHEERPSRVELLALAPPVIGRCALIILATLMLIVLYGCLAFLLDQALFPHIGTQMALSLLEAVAALGALAFAPLPIMLLVGWALRRESGFHPIRELRAVKGAYLPLLAIFLVTALAGLAARSLVALFGSGPAHLVVYLGLSCALGAAWLFTSVLVCKRTFACGGTSNWWKASASRLWDRKIRKPAAAGMSCVLALALSFSLIGFALPALAEEAPDAPVLEPVEPDVYTPPEDIVAFDEGLNATEPSQNEDQADGVLQSEETSEGPEEPEIPALPPEDYYEQPEVEGTPVAIEGEATLLKLTERNYTTVIGGADVAYEDASGTIRKIDNELVVAETDEDAEPVVYRNKANAFTAELSTSEEAGTAGLTLKTVGYEVGLTPQDVDFSRACAEGEAIRYTEARSGIDWQYTLVGSVVKEDIVLAHPVEAQSFDTRIDLPRGLDARMEEGVCVIFRPATADAEEYEVMRIAAPIATDAAGEVSANLTLDLTWMEGVPYLTLAPDWEWLEAPERAYPVRIDPTVDIASAAVRVGCVEQQWRNVHVGENGYAYAGYDMVSKVDDEEIDYTGNSLSRFDQPLGLGIEEDGGVVVVRIGQ